MIQLLTLKRNQFQAPTRASRLQRRLPALLGLLLVLLLVAWSPASVSPAPVDLVLGMSTEGRPIGAVRFGDGPRKLVLVGATHGWPERNTYQLALQLVEHFRVDSSALPADTSLYIVPLLNPDGMELKRRHNVNWVDLNRNMDTSADTCADNDWSRRVYGAYATVSDTGGPYSDSEVETRVIRDFLLDADAVVFFHSNAGVVFPACDHQPSIEMARVFADAAGYAFIPRWDRYPITGGMHDWAGGLGIAAITPELVTGDDPEFGQNLAGVEAVLRNMAALPPPEPGEQGGIAVDPVIWRAWRAWGGEGVFGPPLAPPSSGPDSTTQLFERAMFEYRPALRDTTSVVTVKDLGRLELGAQTVAGEEPQPGSRFFPETERNVDPIFAEFWQINGGLPVFGLPLAAAEQTVDDTGAPVTRQLFERAALVRSQSATSHFEVRLAPLGRAEWAREDATSPEVGVRPR